MSTPKRIRSSVLLVNALIWLLVVAVGALAQNAPSVTRPSAFAVSPSVVDLPDDQEKHPATEHPHHRLPDRDNGENREGPHLFFGSGSCGSVPLAGASSPVFAYVESFSRVSVINVGRQAVVP